MTTKHESILASSMVFLKKDQSCRDQSGTIFCHETLVLLFWILGTLGFLSDGHPSMYFPQTCNVCLALLLKSKELTVVHVKKQSVLYLVVMVMYWCICDTNWWIETTNWYSKVQTPYESHFLTYTTSTQLNRKLKILKFHAVKLCF